MTDPAHRTIQLEIDVVTLAHMVENVASALAYAYDLDGGDPIGQVPLTSEVRALCKVAGLDFAELVRNGRGLAVSDCCEVCEGTGLVSARDGKVSPEAGGAVDGDVCPGCDGIGLERVPFDPVVVTHALDRATIAFINEHRLWPAHSLESHTRLARYAFSVEAYLELTVDAVRGESSDLETVLRGAEEVLRLGEQFK